MIVNEAGMDSRNEPKTIISPTKVGECQSIVDHFIDMINEHLTDPTKRLQSRVITNPTQDTDQYTFKVLGRLKASEIADLKAKLITSGWKNVNVQSSQSNTPLNPKPYYTFVTFQDNESF